VAWSWTGARPLRSRWTREKRPSLETNITIPRAEGDLLPVISHEITQDIINRYAPVSGDLNPLHTDAEYASRTRFGGTIAHGMLVLAYLSEVLTAAFGDAWPRSGRLKARFRGAARPGDTVTVSGTVTKVEGSRISCTVSARNQLDEALITADAEVVI
jgi:3-hydroxybutyryl-CoA dehydratase